MSKNRTVEARSPEYEMLGKNLTAARLALDLSQAEAATKIGISQSTYSGYETGTRRIKLSMLKQIATAYNVTVDQLIGSQAMSGHTLVLSDLERNLILKFRELPEGEKNMILRSLGLNNI